MPSHSNTLAQKKSLKSLTLTKTTPESDNDFTILKKYINFITSLLYLSKVSCFFWQKVVIPQQSTLAFLPRLKPICSDFNLKLWCFYPGEIVCMSALWLQASLPSHPPPFCSPSIQLSVGIFSSFGFNVCAAHVLLSLSPPPPSGWCQCCCQAGVESSQSCGSLLRSSGVMLGSFMLVRWALPNVGHAPPVHSLSLSLFLSSCLTHGHHDISATDTKVCPLAPSHVSPLHMLSRRVGRCTMLWQHLELFDNNWCSRSSRDALFISRQVLPPHPSSHLLCLRKNQTAGEKKQACFPWTLVELILFLPLEATSAVYRDDIFTCHCCQLWMFPHSMNKSVATCFTEPLVVFCLRCLHYGRCSKHLILHNLILIAPKILKNWFQNDTQMKKTLTCNYAVYYTDQNSVI